MYGDSNTSFMPTIFLDECFSDRATASNQLYLFSNGLRPMTQPRKREREIEDTEKHQNSKTLAQNPKRNLVSTGLRLAYDDDEPNSSVSTATGSSIFLPNRDGARMELDRQKEELDHYIKIQAESLARGVQDMNQRHVASLITALEKEIGKRLHEKDVEIENMNRKNQELVERIKSVTAEAQNWHYRAKYNESVVNALKTNLQKVVSQRVAGQAKEGFGDSEIDDDAASCADPNGRCNGHDPAVDNRRQGREGRMSCRACKVKEACVLLVPCRHLCLCKECDVLVNLCPVCQLIKTAGLQVYFS